MEVKGRYIELPKKIRSLRKDQCGPKLPEMTKPRSWKWKMTDLARPRREEVKGIARIWI